MSTNKTENYQLHSWVPSDEFHVNEINENFQKLDQASWFLLGTYVGTGSKLTQDIELGFQPRVVFALPSSGPTLGGTGACAMATPQKSAGNQSLVITDTGFRVAYDTLSMNSATTIYTFLALH